MGKRRMNGEGSITFHKGTGFWMVQRTIDGKRVVKYAKTKALAKEKLNELRRKQELGVKVTKASMPMKVHLKQWLEIWKPRLRESTYEGYALMVNRYLVPRLGHIRLDNLSPEHINAAWERMRLEGISESIIEHCHSRLATSLIYAIKRKWRIDNPLAYVPKPKPEEPTARAFSQEEATAILNTAKSEFNGEYYPVIHTALHTGARRNELLALTWRDIDIDLGTIHITKSIDRRNGKTTIHKTKTNKVRLVTLPPSSGILLRELHGKQRMNGIFYGYKVTENSPVFIRTTGEPLLPRAVTNGFKKIAERAGYSEMKYHLHESRHTHATIMLEQNVHPKIVQERLGHQDIETTLNIYSHVTTSLQKDASDKFDIPSESKNLIQQV
jgi:integrase